MRDNRDAKTIEANYIKKWQFLIKDYELTKQKKHPRYRFAADFYKANNTSRQTFLKYYHRYLDSKDTTFLLPQKRGPKYTIRWDHRIISTLKPNTCLLYTSPSPRDRQKSRMPSSA